MTSTATMSISANAIAASSAVTRSLSRSRLHPRSTSQRARRMAEAAVALIKRTQIRECRHRRIHLRPGKPAILFHRNEHAHPGRASGHRNGHRHRPCAEQFRVAAGEKLSFRHRHSPKAAWLSNSVSMPKTRRSDFRPSPGIAQAMVGRRVDATSASTATPTKIMRFRPITIPCWPNSSSAARPSGRDGCRPFGAGALPGVRPARPRSRFMRGCWATRICRRAEVHTRWVEENMQTVMH